MEELLTYSVVDFIPFSKDAYLRLFENLNQKVWPWHIGLITLALLTCYPVTETTNVAVWLRRGQTFLVAVLWIVLAFTFYPIYGQLNWASQYFVWGAFGMGGAVLFSMPRLVQVLEVAKTTSVIIAILSVFALPICQLAFRNTDQIGSVGLTPLATSVFTIVWVATRGRLAWWLLIPLSIFVCVEGATFFAFHTSN